MPGAGVRAPRPVHLARAADRTYVIAIDTDVDDIGQLRRELPFVDARPVGIHDLVLPPHSVDVAIFAWSL